MKIDRLLSIIIYLLNRKQVSARALAERFEVSQRTIQRDLETIELAGIPIFTVQGPRGGYGIMEQWKLDRQLMGVDDFYYIITALRGVSGSISDTGIDTTLEKVQALVPEQKLDLFSEREEKLSIDFSMLGGDQRHRRVFKIVKRAVETERLLRFSYTSNKLELSQRTVEPMTIAFRWRSWYLYGFCKSRMDYRLFRISRIKDPEILPSRFSRRPRSFNDFLASEENGRHEKKVPVVIRFAPEMGPMVEEYYREEECEHCSDGSLRVRSEAAMGGWFYSYILSFGGYAELEKPKEARQAIAELAQQISQNYFA